MATKRKAKLIDSDSSSDDGGSGSGMDSVNKDLLALSSKRRKKSLDSDGSSRSSVSPPPKQNTVATDSETSDSDDDWDTPKSKKKKIRKKKRPVVNKNSDSEDESGKENKSEPEEGEVSDSDQASSKSGSSDSDSDEEFDDGLDENLIGDEEDRARLQQMTEKEREQELYNRIEKREVMKTRFEIEKKLRHAKRKEQQDQKKKKEKDTDKGKQEKKVSALTDRKRVMEENKQSQSDKFAALKQKREDRIKTAEEREKKEKQQAEKGKDKDKDAESENDDETVKKKNKLKATEVYSSDSDNESVKSRRSNRSRRRSSRSSSSSSSSSSRSDSGSRSDDSDKGRRSPARPKFVTTKEDLELIRLSRHKMEKFCHNPKFEQNVIGCFVRLGIGNNNLGRPTYRVAEIVKVCETAKIYSLGNTRTNKGLMLKHGTQERVFRLEFVSNSPFTDSEFNKWIETIASQDIPRPSMESVTKKQKDVQQLIHHVFTADEIDHMVEQKARFSKNPVNFAMAKTLLVTQRDMASQKGDDIGVEEMNAKISELDERAQVLDKRRNATIASISYINERNRKNNVEKAEKAIIAEMEEKKGNVAGADPFTRRKTMPTMSYGTKVPDIVSTEMLLKLEKERKDKEETDKKKKDEEVVKKKLEEEKKKELERKRIQEEDLFAAHDFDITIDLGVNLPPPTSTPIPRVTPNTSLNGCSLNPTPKRSLNLEEYKKKKGLI